MTPPKYALGSPEQLCQRCVPDLQEFAPSDEELEAYRKGEEWDPKVAEQRRRLKVRRELERFLTSNQTPGNTNNLHSELEVYK